MRQSVFPPLQYIPSCTIREPTTSNHLRQISIWEFLDFPSMYGSWPVHLQVLILLTSSAQAKLLNATKKHPLEINSRKNELPV